MVNIHAKSKDYKLQEFLEGENKLNSLEREAWGT